MSLIRFIFTGDTKQLDDAGKRAERTLKDLGSEFREGISTSAKWTAAMAAAGAALSAHIINKSLDAIDAQAKLAKTLGTTVAGLEVTTRAATLSGVAVDSVAQATKDLTRRLSQAASDTGPAVDALKRLHLTAEQLQQLPLDQRILTINQAIRDFVPAAERAAAAGQLFGEEGSLAMQRIDPETLRQAAKDTERFGTALSQVDAAKVEAAQDAMARVGQVVDGLVNRFTVELAPVLTALSQQFIETADKSGALDDGANKAFDAVVRGAAFAMDAVEGLKRTFEVAGQGIAVFALVARRSLLEVADFVVNGPIEAINKLIELVNKLPGEKFDLPTIEPPQFAQRLSEEVQVAQVAVQEGWAAIQETLMQPLPGGQFLQFVEEAQAAAEQAAEAMAAVTPGGGEEGRPLFTDADREALAEKLEAIRQANETELEELQRKFGEEDAILAEAREARLLSEEQYKAEQMELEQRFQEERTRIEKEGADARAKVAQAESRARMATVGKALSDLSTLMNSESRKMFEIGKAAAIGQTIMETYAGAQKAFTALAGIPIVGPALGAAAAGAAILSGVARVQAIRSQSFGGGGAPAVSNTQAVNAASTPTATDAGGGGAVGPTYTFVGIEPGKMYNGRDIAAALEDYSQNGGRLNLAEAR